MTRPVLGALVAVLALGSVAALWTARGRDDPRPATSDGTAPNGATTDATGTSGSAVDGGGTRPATIPAVGATWQYQLSGPLDVDVAADIFDIDGEETTAEQVTSLHDRGAYVVCYVSAGTFEDWRSDVDAFPQDVLGRPLEDWPGERWLDVRRHDVLLPIMEQRLERCRAKGFDAVELDNVDGYDNDTGFPLTAEDQLRYNRLLADAAHRAGMAVALKNDAEQVADLVDAFDFAVVEECIANGECDRYLPFVERGKPVLLVEYELGIERVCTAARDLGFSAIVKDLDLGAPRQGCDP